MLQDGTHTHTLFCSALEQTSNTKYINYFSAHSHLKLQFSLQFLSGYVIPHQLMKPAEMAQQSWTTKLEIEP